MTHGDASAGREDVGFEQTRDDTDEGWGDWRDEQDRDRWFEEERPPHWE